MVKRTLLSILVLMLGMSYAAIARFDESLSPSIILRSKEESRLQERIRKPTIVIPNLEVESIFNSWGPVSSDVTTIVTEVLVNEPNLSLVPLSIACDIYLNDIKMVEGLGEDLTVERIASGSLVHFTSKIDNENIPKWWVSHIKNGERTQSPTLKSVGVLFSSSVSSAFFRCNASLHLLRHSHTSRRNNRHSTSNYQA